MDDKFVTNNETDVPVPGGGGLRSEPRLAEPPTTSSAREAARAEPRLFLQPPCIAYTDLLVDLSDGELPLDQQQSVRDHVASCPGCQAELARLDASLVQLVQGIVMQKASGGCASRSEPRLSGCGSRSEPRLAAMLRHLQCPSSRLSFAIAATSLACLVALSWFAWHSASESVAKLPEIQTHSQPLLSPADALRQIALAEQCARLQTSLNLLPDDPSYADQRATNQRLLVEFQQAAADAAPRTDNGEAL